MNVESTGGSGMGLFLVIELAVLIFMLAALWRVYAKAGHPGWASLIPIYNFYVMLQIAGKPGWWLLLMFVPIANIIVAILTVVSLAKSFGKGGGFAVGMIFLPIIFYPILGFGDAKYIGAQN